MTDLKTTYMGLKLKNPIIAASSPLSEKVETIRQMEAAGAAAVVMHSVFEEQLAEEAMAIHTHLEAGTESYAEALSYFPHVEEFHMGPEDYLEHIRRAKEAVSIPIISSLNGVTSGGWIEYARQMEQAGADAVECNVYYLPTDPEESGEVVERRYLDVLKAVKSAVSIPVAIKVSPYFSNMARMARQLSEGGADALVLFNRFYQPDIDLDILEVGPHLLLSTPFENRAVLRWVAILHGKIRSSLAATSGIHTGQDVIKMMMAGADVTQICSTLLKHGVDHIREMLVQMTSWMEENEYDSVEQMKGSMSQKNCADPSAFERANYMKTLMSYSRG